MHRVFPSNCGYSAFSQKIQFHWVNTGDSGRVITPLMQVGTYPTRNFATLGPSGIRPPFIDISIQCVQTFSFIFQHWAGVRPYTSFYNFAESCVFTKQLLLPIFFLFSLYYLWKELFIPKLQSQFAEFLQYYFLTPS